MNSWADQSVGGTLTASTQPEILLGLEEVLSFVDEVLPSPMGENLHEPTVKLVTNAVVESKVDNTPFHIVQTETSSDSSDGDVSEINASHTAKKVVGEESPIGVDQMIVATSDKQQPTTLTKVNPRRHRKREKHEIEFLKTQIDKLEAELKSLQIANTTHAKVQTLTRKLWASLGIYSPEDDDDSKNPSILVLDMWKQVAAQQKKEAERSKSENETLRVLLQAQLRLAKKWDAAYSHYQSEARAQGMQLAPLLRQPRERAASYADTIVFSTLGHNLRKMYEQTDRVLQECGLMDVSLNKVASAAQFKTDSDDVIVECSDAYVIPFALEDVDREMWRYRTRTRVSKSGSVYEVHRVSSDTVYTKIAIGIPMPNGDEATAKVHGKTQRFTDPGRVVVVWETTGEIEGVTMKPSWITCWNVLTPHHGDTSLNGSKNKRSRPVCIVKMVVKRIPQLTYFETAEDARRMKTVMNMEIAGCHRSLTSLMKMVEHTLYDTARQADATDC